MFGGGIFLVDLGEVTATTETLVVFAFIFGIILTEHDTVLLRLPLPIPHTIVNQSVAGCPSCVIMLRRQIQRLLPQPFCRLDVIVDALGLVSVHHQGNVVVLMFLFGTLPDCDIRRIVTCSLTVLDEALLKLAEEFVVIRTIVALRESDIKPHKVNFAVAVAHVGHDLIDLLQYRLFASELSFFAGYNGMSVILLLVGDSFVSHVTVFLLLLFFSGYWLFCSLCIEVSPGEFKALSGAYHRYYQLTCF